MPLCRPRDLPWASSPNIRPRQTQAASRCCYEHEQQNRPICRQGLSFRNAEQAKATVGSLLVSGSGPTETNGTRAAWRPPGALARGRFAPSGPLALRRGHYAYARPLEIGFPAATGRRVAALACSGGWVMDPAERPAQEALAVPARTLRALSPAWLRRSMLEVQPEVGYDREHDQKEEGVFQKPGERVLEEFRVRVQQVRQEAVGADQ